MANLALILTLVVVSVLAQAGPPDTQPRPLEWVRTNCVPMKDLYADGPSVARTCRVNQVERLGTIGGRDIYFALYRRIVTIDGRQIEQSALDMWDKPPYNNTALAILEGPAGGSDLHLVRSFTGEGGLGELWYEKPTLVAAPIGRVLLVPGRVGGTGGQRADQFFLRQRGEWAAIDAEWEGPVLATLPRGRWIRAAVTDIKGMRGALLIAKPDDYNCCPTGGWVVATLQLKGLKLTPRRITRHAEEPAWFR